MKLLVLILSQVLSVAVYPNGRLANRTEAASDNGSKVLRQLKTRKPILYGLRYFGHLHTFPFPLRRFLMESTMS